MNYAKLKRHSRRGPYYIGLGLVMLLAAQLSRTMPIAAAIALVGFGATLVVATTRRPATLLLVNVAVYLGLVVLACAAELDLGPRFAVAFDVLMAIAIMLVTCHVTATALRQQAQH